MRGRPFNGNEGKNMWLKLPAHKRIIVAYDRLELHEMESLARRFQGKVWGSKVRAAVITFGLKRIAEALKPYGNLMLDLKFHDTNDAVFENVATAVECEVDFITLHAQGGRDMLIQAREAVGTRPTKLFAVLLPTSLESPVIAAMNHTNRTTMARALLKEAAMANMDGIIYAPQEFGKLDASKFLSASPGIRLPGVSADDHGKTATPAEAIAAGTDYLIIGRPVIEHCLPENVLGRFIDNLENATSKVSS